MLDTQMTDNVVPSPKPASSPKRTRSSPPKSARACSDWAWATPSNGTTGWSSDSCLLSSDPNFFPNTDPLSATLERPGRVRRRIRLPPARRHPPRHPRRPDRPPPGDAAVHHADGRHHPDHRRHPELRDHRRLGRHHPGRLPGPAGYFHRHRSPALHLPRRGTGPGRPRRLRRRHHVLLRQHRHPAGLPGQLPVQPDPRRRRDGRLGLARTVLHRRRLRLRGPLPPPGSLPETLKPEEMASNTPAPSGPRSASTGSPSWPSSLSSAPPRRTTTPGTSGCPAPPAATSRKTPPPSSPSPLSWASSWWSAAGSSASSPTARSMSRWFLITRILAIPSVFLMLMYVQPGIGGFAAVLLGGSLVLVLNMTLYNVVSTSLMPKNMPRYRRGARLRDRRRTLRRHCLLPAGLAPVDEPQLGFPGLRRRPVHPVHHLLPRSTPRQRPLRRKVRIPMNSLELATTTADLTAPVISRSNVLVVGGGPAGVAAAVTAARSGGIRHAAGTLLLPRRPRLRRHGPGAR